MNDLSRAKSRLGVAHRQDSGIPEARRDFEFEMLRVLFAKHTEKLDIPFTPEQKKELHELIEWNA